MRVLCLLPLSARENIGQQSDCKRNMLQQRNCNQDCTVSQEVRDVAFDARFLSGRWGRRHRQLVSAVSGLTVVDQWHQILTPLIMGGGRGI